MSHLTEHDQQIRMVVHRHYHQPVIEVRVEQATILLADFLEALAYEVGAPAMLLTHRTFLERMKKASDRVCASLTREVAPCGAGIVQNVSGG